MIENYMPYGDEWKKELRMMSFKNLEIMFGVEREGRKKDDYIEEIRQTLLFRKAQLL